MICAVAGLFGLLTNSAAQAAAPRSPIGAAARLAPGVVITGSVAHTQRMRVTIGMLPRDSLGLSRFSEAVATPGSPRYGHFLTVHGFARRFGAPQAALIRVRRALRADGLTVTSVAADRLSITASGGAQRIERAFATRLEWAREPRGRSTIIDTAPPSVPRAAAPRTPSPGGIPAFGYTAGTLDAAYGVPSLAAHGDLGQGQTVCGLRAAVARPARHRHLPGLLRDSRHGPHPRRRHAGPRRRGDRG